MRKPISILLIFSVISCFIPNQSFVCIPTKAYTSSYAKSYPIRIRLNGYTKKSIGKAVMIKNKKIYLPTELIAKKFGYGVKHYKKKVILFKGNIKTILTVNSKRVIQGKKKIYLEVKTFKKNRFNYVPVSFVRKVFKTTCDWFSTTKTMVIYKYGKTQKSLYKRLYDSGEYKVFPSEFPSSYKFGCALANKNSRYNYSISVDMSNPKNSREDLHIKITGYDTATRNKVKSILKMAYPYKYKRVYDLLISTLREEIYKHFWDLDNHPGISYIYYDNRMFGVYKELNGANFATIDIGVKNFKYEKAETCESQFEPYHSYPEDLASDIQKYSIYHEK